MRISRWFSAFAFAMVACFGADASAEVLGPQRGSSVREVVVVGEMRGRIDEDDLGIPIGEPLNRTLLRTATQRLYEDGRFSDVQIDVVPIAGGVRLLVRLTPRIFLERIDLSGTNALSNALVMRSLGLEENAEIEPDTVEAGRNRVLEAYAARGYHEAAIAMVLYETNDPNRRVLSVRVTEGRPTRLSHVRFIGEGFPKRNGGARRALGLRAGDVFDQTNMVEQLRNAERKLREAGYLEARLGPYTIERDGAEAVVVIRSRIGRRYHVAIRGNAPIDRGTVLSALELTSDALGSAAAEAMALRVTDLYRRNSFIDAEVSVRRLATNREGEAQLLVEIEPGVPLEVVNIHFPGSQFFTSRFLQGQVESYLTDALAKDRFTTPVDLDAVGRLLDGYRDPDRRAPRPYATDPARIYYPEAYAEAVEHILELYRADGFLDAQVGPYRLARLPRPEGADPSTPTRARVEIPVVEGPRTLVYLLEIDGNSTVTTREIAVAFGINRGDPFSHLAVSQARERVRELYRERGFLYADVTTDFRLSSDRTRAALSVQIEERFPVRIGEVRIEGAIVSSVSMIRELARLREGEVYLPSTVRRAQERLLDLGIFSGVSIGPEDPDLPAELKTIVVSVTERPAQLLDFALGASSAQGIRGAFEYGYGNLFGHAVRFSLRVQLASQFFYLDDILAERFGRLSLADRLERRITAGLALPYIRGIPDLRSSINLLHQRENERNFGLDRNAFNVAFTLRRSRRFTASLTSGIEHNDITLLVDDEYRRVLAQTTDPRLRQLLLVPEGRSAIVSVEGTTSIDLRDNPFDPTRGFFASLTLEWARSIATDSVEIAGEERDFFSHHLRTLISASAYAPLAPRLVFAAQVRYGRLIHLDPRSETYPNRQFFLGGVDTMRAYRQQAMIPQDIAEQVAAGVLDPSMVVQGGDTFLLVRGELRFPIYGDIGMGVFTELGNHWVDPRGLDILALRPTVGLGLRIATPIGPIALDYGFNILYRQPDRIPLQENIGAFNFAIGLF